MALRLPRSFVMALALVMFSSTAAVLAGTLSTQDGVQPTQSSHAPILIQGNDKFTGANGVVGGSGTPADPYVISGWQIDASTANAIEIRDTTAAFTIRDVQVVHSSPNPPYNYAVSLSNATDAAIQDVHVGEGAQGFFLRDVVNVSLARVNQSSDVGADLFAFHMANVSVFDSVFHGNEILAADVAGIRILSNQARLAYVNVATNIVIDSNRLNAIVLNTTDDAQVSRNVVAGTILLGWGPANNTRVLGNVLTGGDAGIRAFQARNLTIEGNNISSATFAGILLNGGTSNVTVMGNRMSNNARGVFVDSVNRLFVAGNDFEDNTLQADVVSGQRLTWNDTYPVGGNHWSDYGGTDLCNGPRQDNCTGPDGIGDTPYVIGATDEDFLPLMAAPPSPPPDLPPHAGFQVTPGWGNTSTVFAFDASSSWDAEDPTSALEVRWDWQSDGIWDTSWSNGKSVNHQFNDPGTYTVRLEVRDTAGLTANDSVAVTVTLPPPAPLSVSIAASPTSGTMPLTVSFSSEAAGGVPPYQYQWVFGDGSTSNVANTVHIYITGGNFTVWLNLDDSARGYALSNVLFINVTPAAVNLTVTPPSEFVATASGVTVNFTATATGGTPPYTYRWDFGDGTQSDQANPTHTYATTGTYTVSVTVTDTTGQSVTRSFTLSVPQHSTPVSGIDLFALFVSGASVAAAVTFGVLWWRGRRKGPAPPTGP